MYLGNGGGGEEEIKFKKLTAFFFFFLKRQFQVERHSSFTIHIILCTFIEHRR